MGFKLLDIPKFIKEKNVKQVRSPNNFDNKSGLMTPDQDGLYSDDIFGPGRKEQKENFGYIDLKSVIMHPLIYKNLKKIKTLFVQVATRSKSAIIKDGMLIEVPKDEGKSGLDFLIDNWNKIDLEKYKRDTNQYYIEFLQKVNKKLIFINKVPIIPIIYRPYRLNKGRVEIDELTEKYQKILMTLYTNDLNEKNSKTMSSNYTSLNSQTPNSPKTAKVSEDTKDEDLFNVLFKNEDKSIKIQKYIQALYDYFITKLESKEGFFRSSLIGKRIDNVTRLVANARPDVPIDCVVIPWHTLLNIFDALVIGYLEAHREYKKDLGLENLTLSDIGKHLYYLYKNCDIYCKSQPTKVELWYKVIEEVLMENPHVRVLMKRDPGWSAQSFWVLKPLINRGCQYVAIVPSFYYVPLAGDSFNCNIFIHQVKNKVIKEDYENDYINLKFENNIYDIKTLDNYFKYL